MIRLNVLSGLCDPRRLAPSGSATQLGVGVQATRKLRRRLFGAGLATAAALPLVMAKPAFAWWRGGIWVGGPLYAAPPVYAVPPIYPAVSPYAYYVPPPSAYVPPAHWVPSHYNWQGAWVPGHWAW